MQDVLRKKKKKTLTLRRIAWALGRRNGAARQRELSEVRRHAPGASATVPGGRSVYVRFALIATELMQRRELSLCATSGREQLQQNNRLYSITSSARTSSVGKNIEAHCLGRDHQCQR